MDKYAATLLGDPGTRHRRTASTQYQGIIHCDSVPVDQTYLWASTFVFIERTEVPQSVSNAARSSIAQEDIRRGRYEIKPKRKRRRENP